MSDLLLENGRILTLADPSGSRSPRRGAAMRELGVIERGWLRVSDGIIAALGEGDAPDDAPRRIDLAGRVMMPGLVDCHTHACWAGDRFDEFDRMLAGATYLELLAEGGGIMSTVRAVRAADTEELAANLVGRVQQMARLGASTIEVKSGYGLSTEDELKMLDAIEEASRLIEPTLVPTFLGAHAIDPDRPQYVEETINETLPAVASRYPGITCDAYCEEGAWSLSQCRRLFEEAQALGCPIRVHADQFNSLGATRLAVEAGARSVDHLEASTQEDMATLAHSDTMGVLLPASGYQLDDRYAAGRELIDMNAAIAVASNCNPGSATTPSLPFAIHLAVKRCRLTPAEAIMAATFNAACVLDLQDDRGTLETGKRADIMVLGASDERALAWEFAAPGPDLLLIAGTVHEFASVGG